MKTPRVCVLSCGAFHGSDCFSAPYQFATHRLEDAIKEQRHGDHARDRDEIGYDFQPANEELTEYRRE
jgi:hypothetical protein